MFLLFIAVCALFYLNTVGLPGFVKRHLITELRARGIELQFSRLRLSWYRGLVADNVRVGQTNDAWRPNLSAQQARLGIDLRAFMRGRLDVHSFGLHNGTLLLPMFSTNGGPQDIELQRINADIDLLPGDEWRLQRFDAQFLGSSLTAYGRLKNASAIRNWPFLRQRKPGSGGSLEARLRRIAEVLDQIEFLEKPQLKLDFEGDGRDPENFAARLTVRAPATETAWGTLKGGFLTARAFPATTNAPAHSSLLLEALEAHTPWANTTNFSLSVDLVAVPGQTNVQAGTLKITAALASTRWARATNVQLDLQLAAPPGQTNLLNAKMALRADAAQTKWAEGFGITANSSWQQALTNPVPLTGDLQLHVDNARSQWGTATNLALSARLLDVESTAPAPPEWAWWTNLAPHRLLWDIRAGRTAARNLVAERVTVAGSWDAPQLIITNLHADIDQRPFQAEGDLNVDSRRAHVRVQSSINPAHVTSVLSPGGRKWLSQFTWSQAPDLVGSLAVTLPAWTNSQPDWRQEVRPTLSIQAHFNVEGGGTYRQIPVSAATSHIQYTNESWILPDLWVTRPEGTLAASHYANERTRDFTWKVRSTFDPQIIRPLLSTNDQRAFDLLQLAEPPVISAEIGGLLGKPETTWFYGQAAVTNFTFRGQSFSAVQTAFDFTNKVLRFADPRAHRDTQQLKADFVVVDINQQQVYITNGLSTADPMPVAKAIGQKVGEVLEPYKFSLPPVVRVSGVVPMRGEEGADLRFTVDGGPFHWHRFNVPRIQGDVHWAGLRLLLTNMKVDFYGGKADGTAQFYFGTEKGKGADYEFAFSATNAILQDVMADYFASTNSLEGSLNGTVVITRANTEDWRQVQGFGALELRDGLIWDIPLFGVLSPVLDNAMPGLGSSRASSATCSFTIRDGVIQTDDLEARSPAMRLKYRGNVDLEGNVDARVEAELLRDMWVLGPIVSTVFWPVTKMFEYRATGTLGDPKLDPIYIFPKLVGIPFQPLRIFRGLFPPKPGATGRNATTPEQKNESDAAPGGAP